MKNSPGESPPALDEMEAMARREFSSLPEEFRDLTGGIMFVLADFADAATLKRMEIRNPYGLLGLFHGLPLAFHLANQAGPNPTMIFLYREPIIAYARAHALDYEEVVRHVLVHEIGHHFGLSDADMHAIEAKAE